MVEQVRLEYHEGSSDKVYLVELRQVSVAAWSVWFAYGRRTLSLTEGFKVERVSERAARVAYEDVVAEKTKKGYRPAEGARVAKVHVRGKEERVWTSKERKKVEE